MRLSIFNSNFRLPSKFYKFLRMILANSSPRSADKDNADATTDDNEESIQKRRINGKTRPINLFYDDESSNDEGDPSTEMSSPFSVTSLLPPCSRSTSLSSSSDEEQPEGLPCPKRKCKSRVKDSLQRLKRARSSAIESSPSNAGDSVSEPGSSGASELCGSSGTSELCNSSGTSELCSSSGGTSTDTVDSGVYLHSFPSINKCKFTSFKRSEKRKFRSYRKASPNSSSDTD